jgi:hypothetical protein
LSKAWNHISNNFYRPFDKDNIPKPAVVAITGDLIEKMNRLHLL